MILKGCMGPTGIALPRTKWGKSEAGDFPFVKFLWQDCQTHIEQDSGNMVRQSKIRPPQKNEVALGLQMTSN